MSNEEIKLLKSSHAEREEKILAFWKERGIFEKTLSKESPKGEYTFYDGPPFATGSPHYGHILIGTIKDVIPRFKTMQGFHVRRRWGWDCHGLPVENLIEKELGLKSKKDIIDYGIEKFNSAARESVMRYAHEWQKVVPRLGRFVDMDNDYRTMDATYTESVWWIFKQLHQKGLIYEGFKSMNLCPHCETTLSNFEVAQGYKDITDISVYVKFKITAGQKIRDSITDDNSYILAWTTTPWTLPGNVALAVNPKVDYYSVKFENKIPDKLKNSAIKIGAIYIASKEFWKKKWGESFEHKSTNAQGRLIDEDVAYLSSYIPGSNLVGMTYEPLFDYYAKDKSIKNIENGWKVYGADFVTTEDGTGIVHIAPAFGSDDYDLLKKYNLPFVQHVSVNGKFKLEVTDFAGMNVKSIDTPDEKDAHQKADIEIIKWLAHHDRLFEKEKLVHSYSHCWRCYTPLLNYATSSWFVKVTDIKDKLVAENNKITWIPPEIGSARFGNWLEGARDWAISRSRFWGAPIPVWREENVCDAKSSTTKGNIHVIGSVDDLKKYSKPKNTYYVARHGQAENNTLNILDSHSDSKYHLTDIGRKQAGDSALKFKSTHIDLIITSPILRTRETAEIFRKELDIDVSKVIVDERIKEYDAGIFNGQSLSRIGENCGNQDRYYWKPEGGEDYTDIKKRMGDFIYSIDKKYEGQKILLVTHETPTMLLFAVANCLTMEQTKETRKSGDFIANAEIRKLDFTPLPHNTEYELDLHRPYIDDIELKTATGNRLTRVPDVFDCWFESGSMPYGEAHFPFEKNDFDPQKGLFHKAKGYPADFIGEGLDQTRGWFYSMLVLGVALFGRTPYKKVIVNGLVLAEDGEKISKSKKNYPDPMLIVDKYGADALRFYMLSSPVVRSQDLCFSEKGVDEINKKIINRLLNVLSFYEMYKNDEKDEKKEVTANILDKWMLTRLNETIALVSDGLEKSELDRAIRPFNDFIEDLSIWYLRRSRDRFKGGDEDDKQIALRTTRYLLIEISKLLAPFTPFLAEDIYSRVSGRLESVHLENWPKAGLIDAGLLAIMKSVRDISSKGLEARMSVKINVRQPLKTLKVKVSPFIKKEGDRMVSELITLIKDEVNVKEVEFDAKIENDVALDTLITPELKEEGDVRELLRKIQDMRKDMGLTVNDKATLVVTLDLKGLIDKNGEAIKKATNLVSIEVGDKLTLMHV